MKIRNTDKSEKKKTDKTEQNQNKKK